MYYLKSKTNEKAFLAVAVAADGKFSRTVSLFSHDTGENDKWREATGGILNIENIVFPSVCLQLCGCFSLP